MRATLFALLAGSLFGAGLALSGMTDPARVRGFLDLFGAWDPTLAFVMGGAVLVMALAWAVQRRMIGPLLAESFFLPSRMGVDRRLVLGSALFGIGWGIGGLCPGPGFAALALAPQPALIFLAGLVGGMVLFRLLPQD